MKSVQSRHGSIVVVIMVAGVIVALGAIAMLMSTSFGRAGYHEKLVSDAKTVARAAVDEAALLINNGKRNVEIDTALGAATPVEVPLAEIEGGKTPLAAIPKEHRPKVYVKAAVIGNKQAEFREGARAQMDKIQKFDLPGADQETKDFWNRVEAEGLKDKESGQDTSGEAAGMFVNGWVRQVGVSGWGPQAQRYAEPEFTDADGVKHWKWRIEARIPELKATWELFNTASGKFLEGQDEIFPEGQKPDIQTAHKGSKPSLADFKTKWEAAIRAVAKDAAKKVEACGANPSLAMAHLVGDLKIGQEIASGAEVAATAAFMRDPILGTNKTYLLEISAGIGYEGAEGRMKGKTAFRTYKLFQKAEWEDAMKMMAKRLAADLQNQGGASLAPGDVAQLWPADPKEPERNLAVPDKGEKDTSLKYDPKKMFDDIVYSEMPSTVGARLYPYGVASVNWDPEKLEAKDASK